MQGLRSSNRSNLTLYPGAMQSPDREPSLEDSTRFDQESDRRGVKKVV
jgi:hypothetical protein